MAGLLFRSAFNYCMVYVYIKKEEENAVYLVNYHQVLSLVRVRSQKVTFLSQIECHSNLCRIFWNSRKLYPPFKLHVTGKSRLQA